MKNFKVASLLGSFVIAFAIGGCQNDMSEMEQIQADANLKSASEKSSGYIVLLKEGAVESFQVETYEAAKEKVRKAGDKLFTNKGLAKKAYRQVYGKAVKGFMVEMTAQEAELLANDAMVMLVEKDKEVKLPTFNILGKPAPQPVAQSTPWGITRIGGAASGVGKVAWVIDSGIDMDHPDLNVDTQRAATFLGSNTTPDDQNGHGTHVAGTIAALDNSVGVIGVAPGAKVVPVRVLDRRGSGAISGVIAGVDYVAANAAAGDAANMSLGGGISTALDQAVLNAAAKGIKFALASGNESRNADTSSPGRVNGTNIYTISAMDKNNVWASFSNYGAAVDYCAPGVSIYSTYKGGGYATLSGTSMATPHVAGILLLTTIKTDGYVINDPDGNPDPIAHR
jgi:subtilisin family serine protease